MRAATLRRGARLALTLLAVAAALVSPRAAFASPPEYGPTPNNPAAPYATCAYTAVDTVSCTMPEWTPGGGTSEWYIADLCGTTGPCIKPNEAAEYPCGSTCTSVRMNDYPHGTLTFTVPEGWVFDSFDYYSVRSCNGSYSDDTAECVNALEYDGTTDWYTYEVTPWTEPTPEPATVALSADDAHRLDLLWWGIWGLIGLQLVALVVPFWRSAWGLEGKLGRG